MLSQIDRSYHVTISQRKRLSSAMLSSSRRWGSTSARKYSRDSKRWPTVWVNWTGEVRHGGSTITITRANSEICLDDMDILRDRNRNGREGRIPSTTAAARSVDPSRSSFPSDVKINPDSIRKRPQWDFEGCACVSVSDSSEVESDARSSRVERKMIDPTLYYDCLPRWNTAGTDMARNGLSHYDDITAWFVGELTWGRDTKCFDDRSPRGLRLIPRSGLSRCWDGWNGATRSTTSMTCKRGSSRHRSSAGNARNAGSHTHKTVPDIVIPSWE